MSKAALSQVIIVLEDGVDIYFARQLVFQRLQTAKEQLPDWAEPEMGPISTGLGEIYQYTLESDTHTPMELRTIQDWYIAPQLRAIPGINEVNSFGGFVKQYHVLVDQNRLLKYGITLTDVLEAIERNNANAGGNFLVRGWEQAYVRSLGLIQGIEDIENIVPQSPGRRARVPARCGRREARTRNPAGRGDARRQGRSRGRHDHHAQGSEFEAGGRGREEGDSEDSGRIAQRGEDQHRSTTGRR